MTYGYGSVPEYPPAVYPGNPVDPDEREGRLPERRSAPIWVHLVAVTQYLGGLVGLSLAVFVALAVAGGDESLAGDYLRLFTIDRVPRPALTGLGLVVAGMIGLCALFAIVLGRKLQRGRRWARILMIVLCEIELSAVLFVAFAYGLRSGGLVALVLPVLYVVLLNMPSARSWFRHRQY